MIKVNLIPLKKSIPTDDIPKPPVKVVTTPIPVSNPEPEDESLDEIWDAVELAESPLKDVRMFQPLASDIANSLTEKVVLPESPLSKYRKDYGNAIYHGIMQAAGFVKVGKKYSGTCKLESEQQKVTLRYVSDYAETRVVDVDLPSDITESILAYYCKKELDAALQQAFAESLGAAVLTPSKTEIPSEQPTVTVHPATTEKKNDHDTSVQSNLDPNHIVIEMQLSKFDSDTIYVKFVDHNGRLVEIPIYIRDIGDINVEDDLDMDAVLQKFASFFDGDIKISPTGEKEMACLYSIYRGDFVIKTARVAAFDTGEPVELNAELLLLLYHILDRYSKMQEFMYLWEMPVLEKHDDAFEEDTEVDDDDMMRAATSFGSNDSEDEEVADEHDHEDIENDPTWAAKVDPYETDLASEAARPSDGDFSSDEDDDTEMFAPIRRKK